MDHCITSSKVVFFHLLKIINVMVSKIKRIVKQLIIVIYCITDYCHFFLPFLQSQRRSPVSLQLEIFWVITKAKLDGAHCQYSELPFSRSTNVAVALWWTKCATQWQAMATTWVIRPKHLGNTCFFTEKPKKTVLDSQLGLEEETGCIFYKTANLLDSKHQMATCLVTLCGLGFMRLS